MIAHNTLFVALVGLFVTASMGTGALFFARARRLAQAPGISELLRRLRPVDRIRLAEVSGYKADGDAASETEFSTEDLFRVLGGLEGLETLSANCAVLIDLACYVQRWYPGALPVAEQLRLNAREFDWHLDRLRGAATRGRLESTFPDYAQRAVALYCGMTQHVVTLFEVSQVPGWSELQTVL